MRASSFLRSASEIMSPSAVTEPPPSSGANPQSSHQSTVATACLQGQHGQIHRSAGPCADANLEGVTLNSQQFGSAKLIGADLTGAEWSKDVAAPDGWVRDPRSGRLRRAHAGA